MTGSEVKRQVMKAVQKWDITLREPAIAALASCTVLTPQEADDLLKLDRAYPMPGVGQPGFAFRQRIRALLSPDPEIFAPRDPHTYVTHEPYCHQRVPAGGPFCTNLPVRAVHTTYGYWGELCDEHYEALEKKLGVDDIGPPAPGEGDDLPNPEIGMEC